MLAQMLEQNQLTLKKIYNYCLARMIKAEIFLNNDRIPVEKREKWVDEAYKISKELSILLDHIQDYDSNNVLNGFDVTPEAEVMQ